MKRVLLQLVYFCLFICCFDVNAKNTSDINTSVDIFTSITKAAEMQPFSVLVKMTPKNDWHIYWNNPGDAGVETKINVQSNNATVVLAKQSTPKHFVIHNLITQFAYNDAAYWLFDVIPDKNNNNDINLSFDIDWQEWMCYAQAESFLPRCRSLQYKVKYRLSDFLRAVFLYGRNNSRTFAAVPSLDE